MSEFDTTDLIQELAAFNLCRKKANSEVAMLRAHNGANSQYPNGRDQMKVNPNDPWHGGATLCRSETLKSV